MGLVTRGFVDQDLEQFRQALGLTPAERFSWAAVEFEGDSGQVLAAVASQTVSCGPYCRQPTTAFVSLRQSWTRCR